DPQARVLLDHIFSQTQANISFLAAQNYISGPEAADIITRLSSAHSRAGNVDSGIANSMQALVLAPSAAAPPHPSRRNVPPAPQSRSNQARGVWGYNEDGREPNDLSFSTGEIIEIIEENNADWWTGKCRGRQGLFPSNHVEKLSPASPSIPSSGPPVNIPAPYSQPPAGPPQPSGPLGGYRNERPVYKPFGATYQAVDQPPPANAPVANSVGLQQAPEPKKSRFGGLGNTMANSAAGGVGFGAGAAIGSGIVNAIF
ncbi:SH3 domain-containing protein, partial [Cytidiella melzeri]